MGKEEIFNYVMETPENTNPNVLRSLLDSSGELPPVTENDNGKVLAVKDGAWAAGNAVSFDASFITGAKYKILIDEGYNADPSFVYASSGDSPTGNDVYHDLISGKQIEAIIYEKDNDTYVPIGATTLFPAVVSWDDSASVNNGHGFGFINLKTMVNEADDRITCITCSCANFNLDSEDDVEFGAAGWIFLKPVNKFIVTLTPTAPDYSGTMDKTVAEINAAYEAGQEIWFKIAVGSDWTEYPLSRVGKLNAFEYPSFNCNALYDESNVLVMIYTGTTDDGTRQTYSTKVYSLTPQAN